MATNGKPTTRRRIPKLSEKSKPGTGRYDTSYRSARGSARRQRVTRDYKESEQLYRRRVIEHYDDSVDIIVRDGVSLNDNQERTLPHFTEALIQHDEGRVRPDGSPTSTSQRCGCPQSTASATQQAGIWAWKLLHHGRTRISIRRARGDR